MVSNTTSYYIKKLSHLHSDRSQRWTDATQKRAPHKPLLLLCVIDLFSQGQVLSNLIEITPELGSLFAAYWAKVMPPERRGNLALPFFHLRSEGFWHLLPQPGQEGALDAIRQVDTLSQLKKLVIGARLDDDLYELLAGTEARDVLRTTLIQTYFAPEVHPRLLEQGEINFQAFQYSQQLIEQARNQPKQASEEAADYQPAVRSQGFRSAVVRIYDHRCAFCGVRMLTSDGHTAVEAAHIIPWGISHNDDLHNGLALCGLCHWTFDKGLLAVSPKYLVLLSSELRFTQNVPGHLLTLEHRPIIGPTEQDLWPSLDAIDWQRRNVYRS